MSIFFLSKVIPIRVKGSLGNEFFVFVSVRSIIGIYYNLSQILILDFSSNSTCQTEEDKKIEE